MFTSCHYLSPGTNPCTFNQVNCIGDIPYIYVNEWFPEQYKKKKVELKVSGNGFCVNKERKFDMMCNNNNFFDRKELLIDSCVSNNGNCERN